MKKIVNCIILITVLLLIFSINSYAVTTGSFKVTSKATELEVGGTTTLTITTTNCEGKFTISSSDSSIVSVSSPSEWITDSTNITLKAQKEGNVTITVTAEDVGDNQTESEEVTGSQTVTIKVNAPAKNETESEKETEQTPDSATQKPAEPTFTNANKTMYATGDINLRASWSTSSAATKIKEGTEVTVTGTSTETINGYVWYRVSYEGQTKYVAKKLLTETKPEVEKSTVKTLKELKIEEGTLDPEFSADVTRYTLQVGNNIEKLNITATPTDEKAKVTITGNEELKSGSNPVKITVTAEDGTARIYNIDVQKDEQDALALTKLEIPGVTLSPSFNPSIYEYSVDIDINSNISDLSIQSEANRENSTIEVIGNENFKEGENVVKILVTSEDGKDKVSYQIIVNKVAMAKQETNLPATTSTNKTMYLYIAIGGLIVIAIIIIIIAIIKKLREDDDDEITPKGTGDFWGDIDDADDFDNNDDEQQIYKSQILREEQQGKSNKLFDYDEEDGKYDEPKIDNREGGRNSSFESKNMDSTRRFSTNYDYTLEDFRKPKNPRGGRGKHF